MFTFTFAFAGTPGTQLNWHGARIVLAVFSALLTRERLAQADTVLFAGSSAGGLGVLVNLERVHALLLRSVPPPGIALRAIVDSAWFVQLPGAAFSTGPVRTSSSSSSSSSGAGRRQQQRVVSSGSVASSTPSNAPPPPSINRQYMLRSEAARTGHGHALGPDADAPQVQESLSSASSNPDAPAVALTPSVRQEPELVAIELSDSTSPAASAPASTQELQSTGGGSDGVSKAKQSISLRSLLRQSRAVRRQPPPQKRSRRWSQQQQKRHSSSSSSSTAASECDSFSTCRRSLVQSLKIAYKYVHMFIITTIQHSVHSYRLLLNNCTSTAYTSNKVSSSFLF